jgi:protein SCO1/2
MLSKKFIIIQLIFWLGVGGIVFSYQQHKAKLNALPVLGVIQDFKLNNSDGFTTSLSDLKGKVWVANFVFTTCGTICPMMTKNMNILHRSFHEYNDVRLVSVSVNPEEDTPEKLTQYSRKYRIDTSHWFFLTGSREDITKLVVESFKLGDIKEPIFHSSYFTLVDRQGRIRGYYDGVDIEKIKKIAQDLTQLMKEK